MAIKENPELPKALQKAIKFSEDRVSKQVMLSEEQKNEINEQLDKIFKDMYENSPQAMSIIFNDESSLDTLFLPSLTKEMTEIAIEEGDYESMAIMKEIYKDSKAVELYVGKVNSKLLEYALYFVGQDEKAQKVAETMDNALKTILLTLQQKSLHFYGVNFEYE